MAGENACPPEDVGGPHGYEHFLPGITDASSEEASAV
ncbi:MAG: IS1096 element passenger TnpR family protein [Steroidobacter sp.]